MWMPKQRGRCLTPITLAACLLAGCAGGPKTPEPRTAESPPATPTTEPPPRIREWMRRLTVPHAYDPATGFIVARAITPLPPLLAAGPRVPEAVARGKETGLPVVVFATADRCAPCQQFKLDALNDPRVLARLGAGDVIAAHIETDREAETAMRYLGGVGIPVTYLLRDGAVAASLPGQRSAEDLLAWLDEHVGPG